MKCIANEKKTKEKKVCRGGEGEREERREEWMGGGRKDKWRDGEGIEGRTEGRRREGEREGEREGGREGEREGEEKGMERV